MRIFEINENVKIVCESQSTRTGFRHIAVLFINGREVERQKCCYINRTWESYEFESVIKKLSNFEYLEIKNKLEIAKEL